MTDKAMWFGKEMEGEKLPLVRATTNRVSINKTVNTKCYRKEPLWAEGTRVGVRKE